MDPVDGDPSAEHDVVASCAMSSPDDLHLPASLMWLNESDDGRSWLQSIPNLMTEASSRWSLNLGEPFEDSSVSVVLPADHDGDSTMALKIQFPHRESDLEATALQVWRGDGAIRLIDHAPDLGALLVERCVPGTHLADAVARPPFRFSPIWSSGWPSHRAAPSLPWLTRRSRGLRTCQPCGRERVNPSNGGYSIMRSSCWRVLPVRKVIRF